MSVFNVDPEMSNRDVAASFMAYGEVKAVTVHPSLQGCRLVEYYDVRHAEAALQALSGSAAKVPTISEVSMV